MDDDVLEGETVTPAEAAADDGHTPFVGMDIASSPSLVLTSSYGGAHIDSPAPPPRMTMSYQFSPATRRNIPRNHSDNLSRSTSSLPSLPLPSSPLLPSSASTPFLHLDPFDEVRKNYVVNEFMFQTASADAVLPIGFSRHDTLRELFGLARCRLLLEQHTASPFTVAKQSLYAHPNLRPRQIFYFFAPHGYGLRTLVVNYAREKRLNLLAVSAPMCAGTELHETRYVPGTYASIIQRALQLEPCILLLDHMRDHWSEQRFSDVGQELFAYWHQAGLDTCLLPKRIFVVIIGIHPYQTCDLRLQSAVSPSMQSDIDALSPSDCGAILWRAYVDCMHAIAIPDDRPEPPGPFQTTQMIRDREERLRKSLFQRAIMARHSYLVNLADRLYYAASDNKSFVAPSALHLLVAHAFGFSCRRVAAEECTRPTEPDAALPNEKELEQAAVNTFSELRLAPPSSSSK
jgi:hypothetical protein